MRQIYSIFVTETSSTGQAEIELDVNSLEELDTVLANNFHNYRELRLYIIHKTSKERPYRSYAPYPKIKVVTKDKHQYTEYYTPIFETIDGNRILTLCNNALNNKEQFPFKKEELRSISSKIRKEEISYEDIRECTFPLKRLGYKNVTERVLDHNLEYDIEKYIKKSNNKTKKRTNDLHF